MRVEGEILVLRIEDDGVGFDTNVVRSAGHLGLANVHARATAFGGTASIESTLGAGTTLSIRVPIPSAEHGS